jgi:hypothetical protein
MLKITILKKKNNKNLNCMKHYYSTYFFFINIYKKKMLVTKSLNEILNFKKSNNYKKSFIYEKRLNKFLQSNIFLKKNLLAIRIKRSWSRENIRLHCLFKEYLFNIYEDDAFNIYLNFLGHYFFKPLKYEFFLTNNMKIKTYLWTSPIIVRLEESPIIELRTINQRINDLIKLKVKFRLWKSFKINYKKIPLLFYENLKKNKN